VARNPLIWYLSRLWRMPPQEVLGVRLYRALRDALPLPPAAAPRTLSLNVPAFPKAWFGPYARAFPDGRVAAIRTADEILDGTIRVFGHRVPLPDKPDWNADPLSAKAFPTGPSSAINFRTPGFPDPKTVWEINRHGFLPALARGTFITGDPRYSRRALNLMLSWVQACPPATTIHWTGGIELGIRIISWVWSLRFMKATSDLDAAALASVTASIHAQARHIRRNLSLYSSAGSHLIVEMAGLATAGASLGVPSWCRLAARTLDQQASRQIRGDGVGAEQSPGYLTHTLEAYLLAHVALGWAGMTLAPATLERLGRAASFLSAVMGPDGRLPPLGDFDDSEILPLSEAPGLPTSLLNALTWLGSGKQARPLDAQPDEKLFWILGAETYSRVAQAPPVSDPPPRAFPDGGYYLLESSAAGRPVTVLFDCGPLGMLPLQGHGHADALSFILRVGALPVLCDPGTGSYDAAAGWRELFRSTAAHNTVRIDRIDQARFLGKFMADDTARAECLGFEDGVAASGRHFGYCRPPDPVVHTRTLRWTGSDAHRGLVISDRLSCKDRHDVEIFFHVDGRCRLEQTRKGSFRITFPEGRLLLDTDPRMAAEILRGDGSPGPGMMSRSFGQVEPAATIVASMTVTSSVTLETEIRFSVSRTREGAA